MVTNATINVNNSKNTTNIKNDASDPVFESTNTDRNTNTTVLTHISTITTHTRDISSNYNNSNRNSNNNDNNFTTTRNGDTTTITSDTLNKVIDDVANNDVHDGNHDVLSVDGNDKDGKNVAIVMSDDMTSQNMQLLPKPSPPPQVIIIPRTTNPASTVATNAAKKIRRAFSMPRNPFRWTHKMKTSAIRATYQNSSSSSEHKTGKTQDSGGGVVNGGGGGGMNFSAISKSYTLSSCVGGKKGRADSFLSLNSNDDNHDNNDGCPPNPNNKSHYNTSTISTISKDTQSQSCILPSKKQEEEQQQSNDITMSSNKKFTTKSNTIHGVSSFSASNASVTLANGGASLSSTMPAGTNNNNTNNNRIFRRSSFRKFLNRIAQHVTTSVSISFLIYLLNEQYYTLIIYDNFII